ncbi:NAD-reducing hydrogenase subunit HoxF [Paramagnetospirillum magnetotacticum MS-1]|uniref:NAD-reducing hydrogenase subunit HoxF n=1 Tax=Paramagnetospirillum magnetotacticum MS-1 TaxID=272627 RepID=A0A0C2UGH0_PARME|nr:NAD(P)H-dependent oxidoreductase subunit E [Paramagnetospirillum magnetotacticum]KIM00623.1 NAD-reducing hydrogenase subunit HoxF [Paramagnetospirillum magnetotacticum MS-1]
MPNGNSNGSDTGAVVAAVLARHGSDGTRLMQILREIQEETEWLSPDILTRVAEGAKLPRGQVEGVAGFYHFFHTEPLGSYRVLWSDNITDRMAGNADLMARMCKKLWLKPGKVSEDGLVSVDTTSCTGLCDQGPALLVNYRPVTRMTAERVDQIVDLIRHKTPLAQWPAEFFHVDDNIRRKDALLGADFKPGDALKALKSPQEVLDAIKESGLRGRGGAGFSTGQKWDFCRAAVGTGPHAAHYVVCNADEGEPGTFKDRVLLSSYADLVFEGMTISGYVIGAKKGFVYLRGEYRYLLEPLNAVLEKRRAAKLLGKSILGRTGFDFDIEIHLGAGAYICGEETALLESLEGKRGVPRKRPPFPVTSGYLNQPTAVNNVETLASAALIAAKGAAWYKSIGTPKSAGTKILSISGDCERPGIYEYPYGVKVSQVLADCGARDTQACQIAGASGLAIAPNEFGRRIAFEDIPTGGSFMIFDNTRDMFQVARNFAHFFVHESCGFCTPCRVGTTLLANAMDKIDEGHGGEYDISDIWRVIRTLKTASHCGLGQTAGNAVADTLQKFRPSYELRLNVRDFEPAFDLDKALSKMREVTGRDDPGAHFHINHRKSRSGLGTKAGEPS